MQGIKSRLAKVSIDQDSNVRLEVGPNAAVIAERPAAYSGSGSRQGIECDFEVAAGAGSATETNSKTLAAIMGNILGADLTKDSNYLAGVIGGYSITGVKATHSPTAAVLGIVYDGAQVDSIILADLDGDDGGAATNARAAFGVSVNNNHASSGCEFGLSLYAAPNTAYGGTPKGFVPTKADIEFSNQQQLRCFTTAITANSTTTNAPIGSIGITSHATGRGKLFMSDGTKWQFAAVA